MNQLLDELLRQRTQPGPRCSVPDFLDRLNEQEAGWVTECIDHPDVQATQLARKLAALYPDLRPPSHYTLQRHRRRDCTCD